MKKDKLSMVFAILALIVFVIAIIGKVAFRMDPVLFICVGGCLVAASVVIKKQD